MVASISACARQQAHIRTSVRLSVCLIASLNAHCADIDDSDDEGGEGKVMSADRSIWWVRWFPSVLGSDVVTFFLPVTCHRRRTRQLSGSEPRERTDTHLTE